MQPVTITVAEAAAYLGVSTDTIYKMVQRREIPHIRIRRRILFRRDTLDTWLSKMERESEVSEDEGGEISADYAS